jgi:HPt (histidine-containing phosphotransfer) domain-containing protein
VPPAPRGLDRRKLTSFAESRRGTSIAPHPYVRSEPGAVDTSNILIVCHSRGALDLSLLKELLGYFVDGNRTRLTQAAYAVQANDREALREIAHAVRGSAALFGAGRLHTLATTIERDAVAGELDNLRAAVTTLSNEFNAVLGALRARHPEVW